MKHRIDAAIVQRQIEALLLAYPELAEDELFRRDMLEGATDLVELMRELETKRQDAMALAEALESTIETMQIRGKRFRRRDDAIRVLMLKMLELAHLRRLELPEATLLIRLGVPKIIITDEAAVPDAFCRFKRDPDKAKIKAAIVDGQAIAGASLSNAEDVLAIKTR